MTTNIHYANKKLHSLLNHLSKGDNNITIHENLSQILNAPNANYLYFALQTINEKLDQLYDEASIHDNDQLAHIRTVKSYFQISNLNKSISLLTQPHSIASRSAFGALRLGAHENIDISELLSNIDSELERWEKSDNEFKELNLSFLIKMKWIVTNYHFLGSSVAKAVGLIVEEYATNENIDRALWDYVKDFIKRNSTVCSLVLFALPGAIVDWPEVVNKVENSHMVTQTIPKLIEYFNSEDSDKDTK